SHSSASVIVPSDKRVMAAAVAARNTVRVAVVESLIVNLPVDGGGAAGARPRTPALTLTFDFSVFVTASAAVGARVARRRNPRSIRAQRARNAEGDMPTLPFETSEYRDRIRRTQESMAAKGIDVLLAADPANMNYLTGY